MTAQTPSAPPSDTSSPIPAVSPAITRVVPVSQRRIDWLVRFAALVIAGGIVFLFATQWDRWVGDAARQAINDAFVQGDLTPLSRRSTSMRARYRSTISSMAKSATFWSRSRPRDEVRFRREGDSQMGPAVGAASRCDRRYR